MMSIVEKRREMTYCQICNSDDLSEELFLKSWRAFSPPGPESEVSISIKDCLGRCYGNASHIATACGCGSTTFIVAA